jgi:hypothetical protein
MSSKRCVPDDPAWTHYLEYRYKHYAHRIYGDDLAGRLMRRSHQWLERVAAIREKKSIILELGSGQCGHRAFVSHPHDQYINSDIEFLTPRAEEDRDYSGSLDWQLMQSAT